MNKITLLMTLFLLHGCGAPDSSTPSTIDGAPSKNTLPSDSKKTSFRDKALWGQPIRGIDFSGNILVKDDTRIHQAHKNKYPELGENFVLWRVTHDGSCWVSAQLAILIFQMIEGGKEKFEEVLGKMRDYAAQHVKKEMLVGKLESLDDFFQIFELIKENMTHRFSLDVRNHQNIYDILDKGMRIFIMTHHQMNNNQKRLDQHLKNPKSWGYADEFAELFESFGLTCPVINLCNIGRGNSFSLKNYDAEAQPLSQQKMLVLDTNNAYIDVVVEKKFSDSINRAQ